MDFIRSGGGWVRKKIFLNIKPLIPINLGLSLFALRCVGVNLLLATLLLWGPLLWQTNILTLTILSIYQASFHNPLFLLPTPQNVEVNCGEFGNPKSDAKCEDLIHELVSVLECN